MLMIIGISDTEEEFQYYFMKYLATFINLSNYKPNKVSFVSFFFVTSLLKLAVAKN